MKAPREDLVRMVPLTEARADSKDDGNTLFGYAAVFEQDTEINSYWEGNFRERIERGAFAKTLKERGDKVKVLFNHGFDPSIGDKPLGKASVQREDDTGLYVEVPLADTSYNRDIKELLNSGALDGMSFRFSVTKEEWDEEPDDGGLPTRTIKEVKLFEYGPVTFPAYEATSAGVRSAKDFVQWRTDPKSIEAAPADKEADTPDGAVTSDADEARTSDAATAKKVEQIKALDAIRFANPNLPIKEEVAA